MSRKNKYHFDIFAFLDIRQSTIFFSNVSMAYSTKGYSVFKTAILKISYFIWNVYSKVTLTLQVSVSELLEYGPMSPISMFTVFRARILRWMAAIDQRKC